ncbi:hypothetical protein KL925_004851 [Ogataea polymorpha]|uniref:uncharacterized protein n=1 Tax=Ogataea polymorpha TaxID=460523 RepID=UPI0007F4DE13|nr:uncharacterized protein OGAPODRAFT_100746 [Ogataea polymorpha]KAG7877727.1 hypothetical protein KL937_004597 [Ogataea polymorpha]KAG7887102.1 hypothetical protein KL936_004623 [Ogataea polymorpha]KAG7925009.1 hypothetical protein KL925_004851 [Ogataea polymorpha]KAG7932133.1 hypothetical protein KL904_004558 [Ogataea polymorpha]OBA15925.1 hypothetical protein OGAPODRAFT_100746 [Ogataea polymorpha]
MLVVFFLVSLAYAFYDNSKNIYELTPKSFDDVIYKTNHTSVVEFYAPWCGYCQQFKSHYIKAAQASSDVAQYAAVNCDLPENKKLCNEYRIEGFPTILVFRPPKWTGKITKKNGHSSEIYRGERTASKLTEFVKGRVKNYVKRVNARDIASFVAVKDKPRVLLLTSKTSISPMFKALAIDFLGSLDFGYLTVTDEIKSEVQKHIEVESLPQIVVIDRDGSFHKYEGPTARTAIAKFLGSFAEAEDGETSERGTFLKGLKKGLYKSYRDFKKSRAGKSKSAKHDKDEL